MIFITCYFILVWSIYYYYCYVFFLFLPYVSFLFTNPFIYKFIYFFLTIQLTPYFTLLSPLTASSFEMWPPFISVSPDPLFFVPIIHNICRFSFPGKFLMIHVVIFQNSCSFFTIPSHFLFRNLFRFQFYPQPPFPCLVF